MDAMTKVDINPDSVRLEDLAARFKVPLHEAIRMASQILSEATYRNDKYQVSVGGPFDVGAPGWPPMLHLTITPLNGEPVHSWGDLQQIKNEICGDEAEAIEVYPAESRKVDMGHTYHLWVFNSAGFRVPVGWVTRMVKGEGEYA